MGKVISLLFPAYPVQKPPIYYEDPANFSCTGERIRETVTTKNAFYEAIKPFFEDVWQERQEVQVAQSMLDPENIPKFCQQFPRWDKQKILDLRAQYVSFDINQDGLIDFEELTAALDNIGDPSDATARRNYFNMIDKDSSGGIDFEEFLTLLYDLDTVRDEADQLHSSFLLASVCDEGMRSAQLLRSLSPRTLLEKHLF